MTTTDEHSVRHPRRPDRGGGRPMTPRTRLSVLIAAAAALALGACGHSGSDAPARGSAVPATAGVTSATAASAASRYTKVLFIAEENHSYGQIIGSPDAPYLNSLATTYGSATRFDAGYPAACPSLAAYILMTSGTTAGICDDLPPKSHPLRGDNVFRQIAASGREWRNYAESAPAPCALTNSWDHRYLVRHVPATYYLSERARCRNWVVPLGEPGNGALNDDVTGGRLPAFGFVSPDACHDMHGAAPCRNGLVREGDRWLQGWLPRILDGPDYRAGRLAIVITWDEGTDTDNHIPTLVISPTTDRVAS